MSVCDRKRAEEEVYLRLFFFEIAAESSLPEMGGEGRGRRTGRRTGRRGGGGGGGGEGSPLKIVD